MEKPKISRLASPHSRPKMSAGEFAMQSISHLVSGASDEEWLRFKADTALI
jgi:hypothetical protein